MFGSKRKNGRASIVGMFGDAFGADGAGVGQVAVAPVAAPPAAGDAATADKLDTLKTLGELRDAGVLTDAEFEAKKAEILASL